MTPRNKVLLIIFFSVLFVACKKSAIPPVPANTIATTVKQDTTTATPNVPPPSTPSETPIQLNEALIGNWKIVSDSIFYRGEVENAAVYKGTQADYLNISADGKMTISENGTTCNGDYTVMSGNRLYVKFSSYFNVGVVGGAAVYSEVAGLLATAHSAIIESDLVTPGGIFGRRYTLVKQ